MLYTKVACAKLRVCINARRARNLCYAWNTNIIEERSPRPIAPRIRDRIYLCMRRARLELSIIRLIKFQMRNSHFFINNNNNCFYELKTATFMWWHPIWSRIFFWSCKNWCAVFNRTNTSNCLLGNKRMTATFLYFYTHSNARLSRIAESGFGALYLLISGVIDFCKSIERPKPALIPFESTHSPGHFLCQFHSSPSMWIKS